MPIYEYRCEACGARLELLQKLSDAPAKDCLTCHKPELKKLMSASAFRLKGGGWYETDFKTKSKKNLAGDGAGETGKSEKDKGETGKGEKDKGKKKEATANASAKPESSPAAKPAKDSGGPAATKTAV